jgi:hypothetical protein
MYTSIWITPGEEQKLNWEIEQEIKRSHQIQEDSCHVATPPRTGNAAAWGKQGAAPELTGKMP